MNSALTMASSGDGYRDVVVGASGALGTAFCRLLKQDPHCANVRASAFSVCTRARWSRRCRNLFAEPRACARQTLPPRNY